MISQVSIKNFKCMRDVTVYLERFTILVGANGSGKTSFLQALDLAATSIVNKGVGTQHRSLLRERGAENGLIAFLDEARTRLAPLIGHFPGNTESPRPGGQA